MNEKQLASTSNVFDRAFRLNTDMNETMSRFSFFALPITDFNPNHRNMNYLLDWKQTDFYYGSNETDIFKEHCLREFSYEKVKNE